MDDKKDLLVPLDLSKCKTNEEVCKLISERVLKLSYFDLLKEVEKRFVFQNKAVKAIYTGLSMNMNVFLSGPGGYGKSTLIKYILNVYNIPYHTVIGYKDMPVDALLGIPNMDKLLNESKYEIAFENSVFHKPGILIGEEFTDILPSTSAVLKDILTEKGYRNKNGKIESLVACMIIAANKSAEEVSDDESKKALYEGRFPIKVDVSWTVHTADRYLKLLKKIFPEKNEKTLLFLSMLYEKNFLENNNIITPRLAIDITKVYLKKGIEFISNFNINLNSIDKIKKNAEQESNKVKGKKLFFALIKEVDSSSEKQLAILYSLYKLSHLKFDDTLTKDYLNTIKELETRLNKLNNEKALDGIVRLTETI